MTVLSSSTMTGDQVVNLEGDKLGTLKDIMIDFDGGTIAYGVVSRGGVASIGEKLFAVPWTMFQLDADGKKIVLDLREEALENSPGFDPDDWPQFSDPGWSGEVHEHFGVDPYWARH